MLNFYCASRVIYIRIYLSIYIQIYDSTSNKYMYYLYRLSIYIYITYIYLYCIIYNFIYKLMCESSIQQTKQQVFIKVLSKISCFFITKSIVYRVKCFKKVLKWLYFFFFFFARERKSTVPRWSKISVYTIVSGTSTPILHT